MRWILIALLATLLACDKGPCGLAQNTLEGSVSELYDIEVDSVRARISRSKNTVTIDFRHGNDSVAKVVAGVEAFEKGAKIPLTDGFVFRVTSPETQFPRAVERGSVTIESDLNAGQVIEGCFNVVFAAQDGQQRTLEGAFSAELQEGV